MRLLTPGFASGSKRTQASLSVTALLNFLRMVFSSSRMEMVAFGFVSDLLILLVGSCRLMTRAPAFGK